MVAARIPENLLAVIDAPTPVPKNHDSLVSLPISY